MVRLEFQCGICLDDTSPHQVRGSDPTAVASLTACGHAFHESCILACYAHKASAKACPLCPTTRIIYAHNVPGPGAPKRKVAHPFQRLFLDVLPSDPESQFQHPPSSVADIPEVRERLRTRASQGGAVVPAILELSEEESEEEGPPVAGPSRPAAGLAQLERARREMAELRATFRSVRVERDELRAQVESAARGRERRLAREADVTRLEGENDELRVRLQQLESGQPLLELEHARVQLLALEEGGNALAGQVEELKARLVEQDNEWRTREIEWAQQRAKMLARISTSGNEGANQIKLLKAELAAEQKLAFERQVNLDKLELKTESRLAKLEAAHSAKLALLTKRTEAAELGRTQAEKRVEDKFDELTRLRKANKNYEEKVARYKRLLAQKGRVVGSSPEPEEEGSPRKLAGPLSPRKSPRAPLRMKNNAFEEESPPPVPMRITMNGSMVRGGAGKKRSVAQIGDSDDEELVIAAQEEREESDDDLIIDEPSQPSLPKRTFHRTLSGPAATGSRNLFRSSSRPQAFPTLALAPSGSNHWAQASQPVQQSRLVEDKYMPDLAAGSVKPAGDKIRHKLTTTRTKNRPL